MSYPFKRILSPIDFDNNSLAALDVAAQITRDNDGRVLLLHVVPMIVPATGMPVYVDIYKGQEQAAREKLNELAAKRLRGVKHEMLTHMGEPAGSILSTARRDAADLIVMATHGRRGLSRVVLGSIAEWSCAMLLVRFCVYGAAMPTRVRWRAG
jgi:universal stress protein A